MIESAFFDSNIFLYAYSLDPSDFLKGSVAGQLLGTCQPIISTQVLQEFISNALRKPRLGIDEGKIDEFLTFTADLPIQPLSHTLILHATALRRRYGFSHWDSTIITAAYANGCATLYSEDLQHGFTLDHLTIVNPF
jgi:predicted nucleic acid-binding protein